MRSLDRRLKECIGGGLRLEQGNAIVFPPMNGITVTVLRETLDTFSSRVAVINPAGKIVLANHAWRASTADGLGLCKRGPGESFFASIDQSMLRGADALRLRSRIKEVLASRRRGFSFECRLRTRASPAWFSIDVVSFHIGGWVHARVALEEITVLKLAERRRAVSEQRVLRIRQNIEKYQRTITRLREGDRSKDEFIATVAHELRNPLAPIMSATEVLRLGHTDRQVSIRACEVIRRQVHMLARLVNDLLDISRIVGGNVELRKERVDVRSVIAVAIETARPLLDQQRHTVRIRIRERPLVVEGDAARLAQIVANVLNNAAKYTNPGGCITVVVARIRDAAIVRVRDTGIGIPRQQLARIFEPFAQVEPKSERTLGGLGVGLALARQLAERHGGTLVGHSEGRGRGSEFTLALPIAAHEVQQPVVAPVREHGATSHRRILIVEDDSDTAETMAALLRVWGHDVVIARDGSVAVTEALTLRPDVMLVDLGLPGLDGYKVAEAVSHCPELAAVPLIALSGHGRDEDRERSERAGFCMHLVKPVDAAMLSDALDRRPHAMAAIH